MLERQRALNERWLAAEQGAVRPRASACRPGTVAAALLGSEERVEYTLVGDTVNLAQRLQDLARPVGPDRDQREHVRGAALASSSACRSTRRRSKGGTRRCRPTASTCSTTWNGDSHMSERRGDRRAAVVVETRGLRKTFESEGAPVRALRGVDFTHDAGRVRRGDGAVGLRQVDAAQHRRRARHADRRRRRRSRASRSSARARTSSRSCAGATSASSSSSSTCSRA